MNGVVFVKSQKENLHEWTGRKTGSDKRYFESTPLVTMRCGVTQLWLSEPHKRRVRREEVPAVPYPNRPLYE